MNYRPPDNYTDADPDDGMLLWLLLAGAPVGGGGCCAGLIALLLCGGVGLGVICQFVQDHLPRLLHLVP